MEIIVTVKWIDRKGSLRFLYDTYKNKLILFKALFEKVLARRSRGGGRETSRLCAEHRV